MFKLFGKKEEKEPATQPVVQRRVVIEGQKPVIAPTPKAVPPVDPLKQRLLFGGMHHDTNPSENVRVSTMTCPSCTTSFRYFLNSDGKKTMVKCPSCTKTFRV
jgi:hypothetical protein